MSNQEYLISYRNYKTMCVNLISESTCKSYTKNADLYLDGAKSLYDKLINIFKNIDFTQFNKEELSELDFKYWDENLVLMPTWALDCLPIGAEIYTINDEKIIINNKTELDKDTRFGLTAYGFMQSQFRDYKISTILK